MLKKKLLAALTAGMFVVGVVPAMAASSANNDKPAVEISKDKVRDNANAQKPAKNGKQTQSQKEQPPEPPKDKDGKPLPPPDGNAKNAPNGNKDCQNGQPPEPPQNQSGNRK